MDDIIYLSILIFAAGLLYSSVGHAGASGYLAAMALFGPFCIYWRGYVPSREYLQTNCRSCPAVHSLPLLSAEADRHCKCVQTGTSPSCDYFGRRDRIALWDRGCGGRHLPDPPDIINGMGRHKANCCGVCCFYSFELHFRSCGASDKREIPAV